MTSKSLPFHLTSREIEILRLLADGQTCKNISEVLNIANSTVKTHIERMKVKCRAHNTAELIFLTSKQGIV